ncbi:hypothetical protein [Nguyenibacter sp. L1]|uniref:hypothetical protein n=1 Tax=Nguyenibacter sp. L1 TaxID=3049350 RepID=UPI002B46A1B7|nr:hypothetical protein [Nguyenibacter sp. L1]WRH89730.1 hypothetical protein QN315_09100 [Nguyenibacter sp. L1]
MPFSRTPRVRRCVALSGLVLLSCCAITPVMAAGRHVSARHHGKPNTPRPSDRGTPSFAPAPDAPPAPSQDDGLSDAALLKGLPPAWTATILDTPPAAAEMQAGGKVAGTGSGKEAPQRASARTSLSEAQGARQAAPSADRILIPVPPHMGIAAFHSGDRFIIVVDNAEPMDTSAIRGDGIFSTLTVRTLPDATLIQVRLPDTRRLYLSQQAEGWVLGDKPPPGDDYADRRMINPRPVEDGILYPMRRPGRVLSISDPASRDRLLVGTSTMDDGGILSLREGDGYDVWPTAEGVVVAARSPDIGMRAEPEGALLSGDGKPIPDRGAAVYASDVDLKWLGLLDLPVSRLAKRYHDALLAAADSDPAHRFARRLDAAKAAFSLGSFVEARGILTVALQDDPEESALPGVGFLLAASELLCGNTQGAAGLGGPWPDGQQRATQVWRGLYLAASGGHEAEAAHLLAEDFARLRAYPGPVRDMVLPMAAEEIGRYGSQGDIVALDDLPPGPAYRLGAAFGQLRFGQRDRAYAAFRTLADDRDPVVAEKASEQRISLDLADGRITPDGAVAAFGSLLPDARLAGRDAALRLLQADADLRMHRWNEALTAIDAARAGPDAASESAAAPLLFQALAGIADTGTQDIGTQGAGPDSLLHDAAMLKAHRSDLPPGVRKGEILVAYGKMLLALGLSDDAAQAFSDAIPMLESPDVRALAGAGLANADIDRKRPQDAMDALTATDDQGLSDDVKATRRRIAARIALATGNRAKALSVLRGDMDAASLDITARIHEGKGEWAAAAGDVRKLAEATIPQAGPLTPDQQILALRLASDASRAADRPMLDWIANRIGDRPMEGDGARMFRLLTRRTDSALADAQMPSAL